MTSRQRLILFATIAGSAMVFLDGTVVNVALPKIGHELPVYDALYAWARREVTSGAAG